MAEAHGWTVELDAEADGTRLVFRDVAGETSQSTEGRSVGVPDAEPMNAPGE